MADGSTMPLLPATIGRYLAARRRDATFMGDCFTDDAYVVDRGRLFKGVDSLVAWQAELDALFPDRILEPLKVISNKQGDEYFVRMRITGQFPGTGMRLNYRFRMSGDRIAALELS